MMLSDEAMHLKPVHTRRGSGIRHEFRRSNTLLKEAPPLGYTEIANISKPTTPRNDIKTAMST
jgi:hypothetical protein